MRLTLILFFLLPAFISSDKLTKSQVVRAQGKKFNCKFVLTYSDSSVNLKQSKVTCTGPKTKIKKPVFVTIKPTNGYVFKGKIKINPTRLLTMSVKPPPPKTTEEPKEPEEIPFEVLDEMFKEEIAQISSKELVTPKPGCGLETKELKAKATKGYTLSSVNKWKDAKIDWSFVSNGDSYAKYGFMTDAKIGLSELDAKVVIKAMKQIEEKTCIRFSMQKPKKGKTWLAVTREATTKTNICQAAYIANTYTGKDVKGLGDVFWGQFDTCFSGAYAYLGSNPGRNQLMVISAMQLSMEQELVGIVVHELLHNLGVGHTQKRPDQKKNIKVLWENIQDNQDAKYQYTMCEGSGCQTLNTPYDCNSIMHYGIYGFSKNGKPTMEALDKNKCKLESKKETLSETDITLLKKMYCDSKPGEKVVTSPNYPKNYPDNQNVAKTLDAGTGNIVELKFTDMNIETHATCSADYVKVVDADSTVLLKESCGTSLPSKITSKTPKVTVTFRSDGSKNEKGFRAEWKAVKKVVAVDGNWSGWSAWSKCTNNKDKKSKCNKKAVRYCNNPAASNGGKACQGNSEKSQLCSSYDLSNPSQNPECVLEGGWSAWGTPTTCSAQCQSSRTRTCSNPTPINHKTCDGDKSKTDSCTGGSCSNSASGFIMSPKYPSNYPFKQDTTKTLEVASGSRIQLKFIDFDIEDGGPTCEYDYVQVLDTDNKGLIKKCGKTIPDTVTSSGNKLTVKFHSDEFINKKGFKAEWKKVEATNSGTIKSPNYPNAYPLGKTKTYDLQVTSGSKIKLTFKDFNVEHEENCGYDYVEVIDSDGKTLKKLCGSTMPAPITSKGNTMKVKFVSDWFENKKGFRADWEKV